MDGSYNASLLPLENGIIDQSMFLEELIDAISKLEVYKEKIHDSKLDSTWFMPTLQRKEALASSAIEGTQATLDGVLMNQLTPNEKDQDINKVINYYLATVNGCKLLRYHDFSHEFFYNMHSTLMTGNVEKPEVIGAYRHLQNYIGKKDKTHAITFIPPAPEKVNELMDNLIDYINTPNDSFRPLVRIAIIHAQFESIHPFMDGNGRVGRMLIPMYLYAKKQIEEPFFFISEALEKDKIKYYTLLNNIRFKGEWDEWIKFFLEAVTTQCDKYINLIKNINALYTDHVNKACSLARSSGMTEVIDALYKNPVTNAKQVVEVTKIPQTSVNRFLGILVDNKILYSDNKPRNRTYYYYALLDLLRE